MERQAFPERGKLIRHRIFLRARRLPRPWSGRELVDIVYSTLCVRRHWDFASVLVSEALEDFVENLGRSPQALKRSRGKSVIANDM